MDSYFAPDNEEFHEMKLSLAGLLRLWPTSKTQHSEALLWVSDLAELELISISIIPAGLKDEQMFWWIFLSPWWRILGLFSFLLKTSKTPPSTLLSHDPISTYSGDLWSSTQGHRVIDKRWWSGFSFHYVWTLITQIKGRVQMLFHSFLLHWRYDVALMPLNSCGGKC